MTNDSMNKTRFEEIVWAYGASPSNWPEEERSQAIDFASSNEAQKVMQRAELLDASLSNLPNPLPASDDFINRLIDIPNKDAVIPAGNYQPSSQPGNVSGGFWGGVAAGLLPGIRIPQLAGLFTACVLGVILGVSNVARYDSNTQSVDASAFIYSSPSVIADLKDFK